MNNFREILTRVEQVAIQAGAAILDIYQLPEQQQGIRNKQDNSPVTSADLAADRIISKQLIDLFPGTPVITEEVEATAFKERKNWSRFWLVDPLDGTKEFIRRSGEFTVNIALIENGAPVLGCIFIPCTNTLYSGIKGLGAWKVQSGNRTAIATRDLATCAGSVLKVVGSRAFGVPEIPEALTRNFSLVRYLSAGSSLKFCLVAEGKADLYPRFAPSKEWDIAAGHAILEAAGGVLLDQNLRLFSYNSESLCSPNFYAIGDKSFNWSDLYCV